VSSDFVFKAVRFATRDLAEEVDAASARVAKQRTGNAKAKANRSAFVVEAALELAHVILRKRLTSEHYLPVDHQPRATTGKCLVLSSVGSKPKKVVTALHRVTGWDRQYLKRIVAKAPVVLVDNPTKEEIRVLEKAALPLGAVFEIRTATQGVRTNVAVRPSEMESIEAAARSTNHHISPFLTWAALLKAGTVLFEDEPDDEEDDEEDDETGSEEDGGGESALEEDDDTRITITSRLPVHAVERMDEFCDDHEWTRTEFVEEASAYFIAVVQKERLTSNLLPDTHSLNGERTMVSVKVDFDVKSKMTSSGASLNHTTTGFLVWAILAYLKHHNYL
jgi:uncharacterized protein (DUF1778 family)